MNIVQFGNGYKMYELENEKKILREEYILIRSRIENKKEKSNTIVDKIIKTDQYKDSKIIAIYKSMKTEVDTSKLIKYSINNGKIIALPRVEENELKFYKINSTEENLEKSKFGIEEPLGKKENLIDSNLIDLVIVPGICFDLEKNRLGFGKGYYDRFLKQKDFKSIGICFDEQITKKVPTNNNDMKVKEIITEKRHIL